ncbi:helix-turn-helix domain-containing protein [Nocardia sp. SC052]|uniref:helix-turn-helix domain-containing protein n=1 Tax=Nocardia sichangensis TaxID=3385975 RepID=UPI0039A0E66A
MVRKLVDAALTVISAAGTTGRPRVTDIVAAAGLSNDACYRHFPSKDALVASPAGGRSGAVDRLCGPLDGQGRRPACARRALGRGDPGAGRRADRGRDTGRALDRRWAGPGVDGLT